MSLWQYAACFFFLTTYSHSQVSLLTLHCGLYQGWVSPMSLKLKSEDSPVEVMTKDELANLAAFPNYVGLFTSFVISYIAQTCGRKNATFVIGVLATVGGVIVTFAPSKIWLYVARGVIVTAGGSITNSPMYISETVHDSIRGTMMGMCTLQLNIGILISYTAGSKLSYKVYNSFFIILPVLYTFLIYWIPETPYYLVEKSRVEDARKSMIWYRGGDCRSADIEIEKIISSMSQKQEKPSLREIVTSKTTRLALNISLFAYIFQTLSGIHAILNYSGIIFEESGSVLSPANSSIVIACILLGASVINVLLMDKLGRKPLMYISLVGGAVGLIVLSAFLYARMKGASVENLGWIPISSLSVFVFAYGVGLAAVPGALVNEVTPTNIKPTIGAIVHILAFLCLMVVLQSFPYLDDSLGLYSVIAIPAVFNVLGVIYTWWMIPETKGKSLEEIEAELKNR